MWLSVCVALSGRGDHQLCDYFQCASLCLAEVTIDCMAFNYNSNEQKCSLFNVTKRLIGLYASDDVTYYEHNSGRSYHSAIIWRQIHHVSNRLFVITMHWLIDDTMTCFDENPATAVRRLSGFSVTQ